MVGLELSDWSPRISVDTLNGIPVIGISPAFVPAVTEKWYQYVSERTSEQNIRPTHHSQHHEVQNRRLSYL